MLRLVFALLFGVAVIRRCSSEEPKWEQTDNDKDKPEARFAVIEGFRPHFPGPYGPNSDPIRPAFDHHNYGFGRPNFIRFRPGRPHYPAHDSCRCSFNCPDLIVGSCGKGRRFCCSNGGGFSASSSQTYYPVSYYGAVNHLAASNNYASAGYNSGYQFPDYYRPYIDFGSDSQPNGLPGEPHRADVAIFARSGNTDSQKDDKGRDNTSS